MIRVRAAVEADLESVLRVERGVAEAPHWREGEYRAAVEGVGVPRCIMVAELAGAVVGFAVGKVAAGVGELESVAVAAAARRMGAGRALCEAVVGWCGLAGARVIELEVRAGSAGAIALYAGLGFVVVGQRKGYYRDPVEDALLMGIELEDTR